MYCVVARVLIKTEVGGTIVCRWGGGCGGERGMGWRREREREIERATGCFGKTYEKWRPAGAFGYVCRDVATVQQETRCFWVGGDWTNWRAANSVRQRCVPHYLQWVALLHRHVKFIELEISDFPTKIPFHSRTAMFHAANEIRRMRFDK